MKLTIQPDNHKTFTIRIPQSSVAKSIAKGVDEDQVGMSRKEMTKIFKAELKKMKQDHPDLPIIEVKDDDGTHIVLGF